MKLSKDQKSALKSILAWLKDKERSQYLTLGGYAGTGKTTLTAMLRRLLHKRNEKLKIALISYTGKASRVLDATLRKHDARFDQDFVGTIHSYIYAPIVSSGGVVTGWKKKSSLDAQLIIVDEASMVNLDIFRDLISFDLPILAIGDHGQLPPIHGDFNLMEDPNIKLEKIHRQAQDNPIIKLSIKARKKGFIEPGQYGSAVEKIDQTSFDSQQRIEDLLSQYDDDTLVLSGYNHTRVKINDFIRQKRFFDPQIEPMEGDRVICLRNNHQKNIYNGMLGTLINIKPFEDIFYKVQIEMDIDDQVFQGKVLKDQFGAKSTMSRTKEGKKIPDDVDLFDFGYALTVHKAQGSQAQKVILFEERFKQMNDQQWRRWLYTGITRAEEELYLIGS